MKRQKYIFNHRTLRFEKYILTKKAIFGRAFLALLTFGGFAFLFAFILYTFFSSPKERMQARELEYMKLQYEVLNDKLDNMAVILEDLEKRDDNVYRVVFEAEPIPRSVRNAGYGGMHRYDNLYGYANSDIVVSASKKMDIIASQLYAQSQSYDEVFTMARNKTEMLSSIPAIVPVKEKDIKYISSYFGYRPDPIYNVTKFHSGMDFSAKEGTDVYATGDGVVCEVKQMHWGYGNVVTIDHGYGYKTRYAHLKKFAVRNGQKVKRGQLIGYVGATGKATGAHLHYEVLKNDVNIDPIHFFYNDLTPDQYEQILIQSTVPTKTMD